jgi:hypothetical protein
MTELSFSRAIARSVKIFSKIPDFASHEPKKLIDGLKLVNAAGLLTYVSSAGRNKEPLVTTEGALPDIMSERAMVGGFILRDVALVFVDWINTHTDKVAIIPVYVKGRRNINIENHVPIAIAMIHKGSEKEAFFYINGYMTPEIESSNREEVNLSPDVDVLSVTIFDPKWGRYAWVKDGLINDVLAGLKASH